MTTPGSAVGLAQFFFAIRPLHRPALSIAATAAPLGRLPIDEGMPTSAGTRVVALAGDPVRNVRVPATGALDGILIAEAITSSHGQGRRVVAARPSRYHTQQTLARRGTAAVINEGTG